MTRVCPDKVAVNVPRYLILLPLYFVYMVVRGRAGSVRYKCWMPISKRFIAVDIGLYLVWSIAEKFEVNLIVKRYRSFTFYTLNFYLLPLATLYIVLLSNSSLQ
jgi:hypothetical protein